ncbi:hypothetical protein [Saccharothrix hoggarensis]|uniref:Uncharacterized protein n=1 Tax=Saccharothrix hoggarensis TaxID=913853 RepID=A0ABW3QSU6_9PSEU
MPDEENDQRPPNKIEKTRRESLSEQLTLVLCALVHVVALVGELVDLLSS